MEEVQEADLLVHVLDASSSNVANQRQAVYKVLRELGLPDSRLQSHSIEVWNKIDLLPEDEKEDHEGSREEAFGMNAPEPSRQADDYQEDVESMSLHSGTTFERGKLGKEESVESIGDRNQSVGSASNMHSKDDDHDYKQQLIWQMIEVSSPYSTLLLLATHVLAQ